MYFYLRGCEVITLLNLTCMSVEWMNECVDGLFITQLLKACLSTVRVG
jgi:hypothetical protein